MDSPEPEGLFLGDMDDPWVAAIAGALPRGTLVVPCPGDLPENWPDLAKTARFVVLHRAIPTFADAERLRKFRQANRLVDDPTPRVILCVGLHARYHHLERWTPWVDRIVPEATAAETIARELLPQPTRMRVAVPRPSLAIVSTNYELRQVLAESCRLAGYPTELARDWDDAPRTGPAVWDVPVLEDDWPRRLVDQARSRAVVALIGFADRAQVTRARTAGASACLDLPVDPADLVYVIDRVAANRSRFLVDSGHAVPPNPVPSRPGIPRAIERSR
ncbi:MAG: hypothetical protein ABI353_04650 [Isosphaeraceae bacterium]